MSDWFRSPDWGPEVKAAFEARLARARPHKRPQYRRIKAVGLLETGDPARAAAGRELLEHVAVDPEAYEFERTMALSILGAHELTAGLLDDAERHLRAALRALTVNPSGGCGLEPVMLAEILLARGGRAELEEARDLLHGLPESRPLLLRDRFRRCLASVRVSLALGDADTAASWAIAALRLDTATHSGLANHPRLGLVETDDATRAWLAAVATMGLGGGDHRA